MVKERLTRQEIEKKYPGQYLGLDNVKYKDDDGSTIEEADVIYTDKSMEELLNIQFDTNGKILAFYTGRDRDLPLGAVEIFG